MTGLNKTHSNMVINNFFVNTIDLLIRMEGTAGFARKLCISDLDHVVFMFGLICLDQCFHANARVLTRDLPVIEPDGSICYMVIAIIMAYDDYCFAFGSQLRQKLVIENALEVRVLIGSPFIKDVY